MYGQLSVKIVINHKIWGYSLILHSCENKFRPINQNSENSENSENSDVRFSDRPISSPSQTKRHAHAAVLQFRLSQPLHLSKNRPGDPTWFHWIAKDWGYISGALWVTGGGYRMGDCIFIWKPMFDDSGSPRDQIHPTCCNPKGVLRVPSCTCLASITSVRPALLLDTWIYQTNFP
jgi:hypothetical protein